MKRVLITGGNGFLGSHLTDFLLDKGFEVHVLKRPYSRIKGLIHYVEKEQFDEIEKEIAFNKRIKIPTNNENLNLLECDIKNRDLIKTIIIELKPELIFHFAAQPFVIPSWEDPINTIETNVIGTLNVFEPIKKNQIKTRVIVACSSAEYGTTTTLNRPLKEDDPLMAIHPYGISKIATELLARQYYINFGIETVNLRFFNQTGPRKENDACSDFVKKVAEIELGLSEPIIHVGNLRPYRDILGYKDSIQAIWLAATKGKPGETYNVCSSRKMQIKKILDIALSFSTKKIKVIENVKEKLRKTDEDIILGDNTKIRTELGFKVTQSIEDILKEMYDYWIDYYSKKN
ncbi:MAG: GDP-mannose 4,6-dehydratase [Promethearchaeota archaeon]